MTRLIRFGVTAATALVVLTGTAACGSDAASSDSSATTAKKTPAPSSDSGATATPSKKADGSSGGSSSGTATSVVLTIKDFAYKGPGTVKPGTEITVKNDDTAAHTVTADGAGGFDVILQPGKSATFKAPDKAGSYKYHCTYHANMAGTLTVG